MGGAYNRQRHAEVVSKKRAEDFEWRVGAGKAEILVEVEAKVVLQAWIAEIMAYGRGKRFTPVERFLHETDGNGGGKISPQRPRRAAENAEKRQKN